MGWRKFCSAASHPYGKQYKAAFRKSVFPSQIPYLINGDPKGSLQEAAQNILDQIFLSPAIPTNYNLTTSAQPPDPPFSPQEISAVIEHLPSGKAPGIDGIDNLLIKIIHKRFNNIFPTLFNKCLHLSCFPDSLKIGNIILFQKGGKDQRLASSYRPISLLPTIGKVLEKLMTQRLTYHLESTNSLNDRQHGFREGKSVDTAINELLRNIKTARRDGKHVLVLSIDIKGAFDNLQHRAILKTLDASACPSNINRLFHSLLQNRKVTLLTPQGRATKEQNLVSKSNIQNEEETFFDSKAIPTPYISLSGAYRTTPTAALQTILGIPPLHMQLQLEARFTSIYRLRIPLPPFITDTQPHDLEMKATGWSTHPSEHLKPNQISFEDGEAYTARKDIINIFTDGSKTEHGVGAAFFVLTNDIWAYQWSAKLHDNNTVFQAELTALHEAVIYASHLPNYNTSNIHVAIEQVSWHPPIQRAQTKQQ
ncbi:Putative protein in type-1 retrotransposable element R1DM, partial [Araneus ventricosus]